MMSLIFVALFSALLFQSPLANNSYSNALSHFNYDKSAPLNLKELSVREYREVKVYDITYSGAEAEPVPASLVVPAGKGRFAAIIWGHWMMPGSPTANRSEFLGEALALAPGGVISLLIDAPYVRPGFKRDPTPLNAQDAEVVAQQVIDLRRGVDLLLSRRDVDPHRVGYVGHSFDAGCGAILDAVDKRLAAFVFMADPESIRGFILKSSYPPVMKLRKSVSERKLEQYLSTYYWADPTTYASHLGPAPAFFEYATHDVFTPVDLPQQFFRAASGPKRAKFYDADHALNAEARLDRYEFLRTHLGFGLIPVTTLDKIPPTG
jgi:cephalosporin-C deacetylase-like acetyl esterase